MTEGRYTVSEIDAMREALMQWRMMGCTFPGDVEEMLRTYMLNGSPPEEVIAHCKDKQAEAQKWRDEAAAEFMAEEREREARLKK